MLFQDPGSYFKGELPITLDGASAAIASNYTKRPHVFRLKLAAGGEYLFQCKDEVSKSISLFFVQSIICF